MPGPDADAGDGEPARLVSVIIPAFNAASYLAQAVSSALAQTRAAVEVIVIDDGSTDATSAVITQLAAADPRVVPIMLGQHQGVSAARNAGLSRARGEWVAPLDADDAFLPERLAALLAAADRSGADLIADNLRIRDFASGAPLGLAFPTTWMDGATDVTIRTLLERDIAGLYRREIGFIKPLIRRRLLTEHGIRYNEDVTAGEDLLFYITCLSAGGRLRLVPEAHYVYAMRSGSVSSTGAANLGCCQVNQILQALYQGQNPAIEALLALRGAAIDYELFLWHLRNRHPRAAFTQARLVPSHFFAAKLSGALRRRLGMPAVNPAAAALARITTRFPSQ